jgi:hypothetical protein
VLTIPDHAQGAAIGGGGLWIARSDWSWGTLDRLDPATGTPQRRYEIAPGTEGIAFGSAGRLWAVSEAGSRHIYDYPFLAKLRAKETHCRKPALDRSAMTLIGVSPSRPCRLNRSRFCRIGCSVCPLDPLHATATKFGYGHGL